MNPIRLLALMTVIVLGLLTACGGGDTQADRTEDPSEGQAGEETTVEVIEEIGETEVVYPEMTEEEMTAWVMENCICPQCPSWIPEAAEKGEGGYCAVGMSECIVEEVGCICPDCPVTQAKGLEWGYYCTRGSAAEMMEDQESAAQ